MPNIHEICQSHLLAAVRKAGRNSSADAVGRAMLGEVIELWKRERSIADIKAELEATAENLDPDEEYAFMRP